MAADLPHLEICNRRAFRTWLRRHHASSAGIWLVFHKQHTGKPSIPYEDAVREALCFGWIDSLIKRLDDGRYLRKFTPRKPTSKWSDLNRRRWTDEEAAGRLAAAGRTAAPTSNRAVRPSLDDIPALPSYIAKAFRASPKAWGFFQTLPAGARRHFVLWIHTAKRPDTREKRIAESLALLEAGKRLGLK